MQRYPLSWPAGWKRIAPGYRRSAKFKKGERVYPQGGGSSWVRHRELSVSDGVQRVLGELRMLGVQEGDAIISTNLQVRLDGLPRSGQAEPMDPGVAVYWQRPVEPSRVMAIDLYDRVADNLAAIAATLEAMRAIERHGGAQILERAFTGFDALPAPGQTASRGWPEVLELNGERTIEKARENYRRLSSIRHPDKGGTHEAMAELNAAWQQAQEALRA